MGRGHGARLRGEWRRCRGRRGRGRLSGRGLRRRGGRRRRQRAGRHPLERFGHGVRQVVETLADRAKGLLSLQKVCGGVVDDDVGKLGREAPNGLADGLLGPQVRRQSEALAHHLRGVHFERTLRPVDEEDEHGKIAAVDRGAARHQGPKPGEGNRRGVHDAEIEALPRRRETYTGPRLREAVNGTQLVAELQDLHSVSFLKQPPQ